MIETICEPISLVELLNQRDGLSLSKGQIQIWSVPLDGSETLVQEAKAALSEFETERVPFFKFEAVQRNYIISQGMLRILLSLYQKCKVSEIRIGRHKKGKPFCLNNPNLRFNISNSGNKVVYAFSLDGELGIDLEQLRKVDDFDDLVKKNFSSAEQAYINKIPDEREARFFKFWTIKEAYLKAIGEGMRIPPDYLEFSVEKGQYKLQAVKGVFELEDWIFKNFTLQDNHIGTLAIKTKNAEIQLRSIT